MTHQLGDGPIEPEYFEKMNVLARFLDDEFNGGAEGDDRSTGFVLLVFPFGDNTGRCNFISNGADRADVAKLFREMVPKLEQQ